MGAERTTGHPAGDILEAAGCIATHEESFSTYIIPDKYGYGTIQIFASSPGMVALKMNIFLYEPLKLSSLELFPVHERSFLFLRDIDKDEVITCHMPASSATDRATLDLPAGRLVRIVEFAYREKEFRAYLGKRYSNDDGEQARALYHLPRHLNVEHVLQLFQRLGDITLTADAAQRSISSSMSLFLFYLTNNTFEFCETCDIQGGCHSQDKMGLCAVTAYFLEHPADSPSIEKLSHIAGMSPTKLKTLFKKQYGDTLYGYLRTLRMNLAANYLREGRSVTEVSYAVGYKSVNRFSEAFRLVFGEYPGKVKTSL
ncbi:helix-turn-helix transcriptional regulator [Parasphaerochaeta coccoides]|nr:AraC family transcriptional regulator [Parasphaerochaeta coccoides]